MRRRGESCKSGDIEDRVGMDICLVQFVNTPATHKGSVPADSLWVHRARGHQCFSLQHFSYQKHIRSLFHKHDEEHSNFFQLTSSSSLDSFLHVLNKGTGEEGEEVLLQNAHTGLV